MKQAFGYLRVSTEGQTDRDGFPRQRQAILDFAAQNEIEIARFFEEEVSGADDALDRPVFSAMVGALESNGVKHVVIEKLDRLARDVRVQENIIFNFQKTGWDIISTREPDLCSKDPEREAFRIMQGLFAQYDRKNLVRRLKAARDRNSKKAGRRVEGRKKLGQHLEEQIALNRMRELQAQGRSCCAIATTLNAEGVRTHKLNGKWHASNVARLLRRTDWSNYAKSTPPNA
jgi:site-specific DNA recombinase